MTDQLDERLSPETLARIFDAEIHPLLFDNNPTTTEQPTLVLLGGQPGAGKSRATHRILADYQHTLVPLSGDDLRAFHPHYRHLVTDRPTAAPGIIAEATAHWVLASIDHARTTKRSLLLEGTFHTPHLTLRTAQQFADAGFHVHVIIVGTPRHESLLAVTSRYYQQRALGQPARFTSRPAHDRGYDGTTALVAALDGSSHVDRVTILDRSGANVFDVERVDDRQAPTQVAASIALEQVRAPQVGGRSGVEWLGELRHITAYALETNQIVPETADLLVPLYEIALRDIAPAIPLPEGSRPGIELQRRLGADFEDIQHALARYQAAHDIDAAAPHLAPTEQLSVSLAPRL